MNNRSIDPKIIAYYLPQYHEIPENNAWWGKGFTEWTNVKKAKPFYKGQKQPRIPLNNNYYDLMNRETVEWQTNLAKKYGIYGFCYFHYFFKNGRKILEKPAENILKWKDIDQRFCFFWANVDWRRTWRVVAKTHATTWNVEDELIYDADDGLLMEQDYGDEQLWKEHFYYLLPFFKDDRYIKIDGKPIFAIYFISYIPQAKEMFCLWEELAKKNGLPGLEILAVNEKIDSNDYIKGIIHYGNGQVESVLGYRIWRQIKGLQTKFFQLLGKSSSNMVISYNRYWKYILQDKPYGQKQNFPGATVRYDETPRKGKKAFCLINDTPESFRKFLAKQLKRGREIFNTDYLFLDAWNEWGEGNYLEPDEEMGFQYLEAVRDAIDSYKNTEEFTHY